MPTKHGRSLFDDTQQSRTKGWNYKMASSRNAKVLALATLAVVGTGTAHSAANGVPAHGRAVVLFNGADLSNFDTFLKSTGLNSDPKHVFQVEHGVIHISGQEFGYIITKQDYQNYYLRAEFKWGEGTYAPRQGQ